MMSLNGKVVLITGAGRGIGLGIAHCFVQQGASVVVTDLDAAMTQAAELELGKDAMGLVADAASQVAMRDAVNQVIGRYGKLDVLVNNAGITKDNLLMRMSDDQWDDVLNINLKGSFTCTRSVIKHMMKKKFGRIINITSIVGITGNAGQANYAASKSGLIGLTKSIAKEVASRGITANCVAPGWIETSMTDQLSTEVKNKFLSQIPTGKIGQSKDIANTVIFLASDEASYITGQTITVDGGRIIN